MRKVTLLLIVLAASFFAQGQIFKKLGDKIKRDSEWRIRSKADQQVARGIDSVAAIPKKMIDKKKAKKEAANTNADVEKPVSDNDEQTKKPGKQDASVVEDENDMEPKDGFASLTLSNDAIFVGGIIGITGESVRYKNYKDVEITVAGPSAKDVKSIPLDASGKFSTGWYANGKTGNYTVTLKGSDKKSVKSARFTVYDLPQLESICDDNIDLTEKALKHLEESVAQVKGEIGSRDKAALDEKMKEAKEKIDLLLKLYRELNKAGKEIANLVKSGKAISPNLAGNLSNLNDNLKEQRRKMEQVEEFRNHKPADNTVCEYLVVANEACAAFSLYTNFESRVMKGIIKDIMLDKLVPQAVGTVNARMKHNLSSPYEFIAKEPAKIFATAAIDAESLTSKLMTAGLTSDIIQFSTEILMKKYCGVFKGTLRHDYTIEFRNKSGQNWWTYGVEMKAALSLRYPKEKAKGNIIKMKGNLEGNGTKFTFFEDIEKNDEFQDGSKGKIEVVPIKAYTPFSVSVATSELDVMGFGAIARGMATPAYFNIPIDAEYDVNNNKIKIFINPPIIDFSPAVSNQLVFLLIGGDLLPYVKRMTFPINKAFRTIGSIVRDNHEFDVKKDAKGNLSFEGKANKHIGARSSVIETDLNITIKAKKE